MKRKLILAGLFMIGLILVLVWVQGGFHLKVPGGRTVLPEKKELTVRTIKVEPSQSAGLVSVPGSVVSREVARVAARAQGYVIELKAEAGEKVTKGQVLLKIDSKEMVEREAQAKAALASAEAESSTAAKDLERYGGLFEKGAIARKQLDDVTTRYETAKAAESRAQAALEEARTMLSYTVVTAPFGGIVGERDVNAGDFVTPGRLLFTVYRPGTAELVAAIGEQYAPYLKEGTKVTVRIPSIDLEQQTTIREVVPQRDVKTRTITVKAPLAEASGLSPGLYGTLTFDTQTSEVIMIPAKAVTTVGQLATVKVLEHGAIRIRNVKTGRKMDDTVEILSGLNPGEELVVE
jgi:RND family efflux transporter MFP subunit